MSRFRILLKIIFKGIGGVLAIVLAYTPEQVKTHISAWFPMWHLALTAPQWVYFSIATLMFIWLCWPYRRRVAPWITTQLKNLLGISHVLSNPGATKTTIKRTTAEIEKRVAVLDRAYGILTNECYHAYVHGHQLRNAWESEISALGGNEFAEQLQEFGREFREGQNHFAALYRECGLHEDIIKFLRENEYKGHISAATGKFMNDVRTLPVGVDRNIVRLLLPQQQKFSEEIDKYWNWIEELKQAISLKRSQELG